MLAFNPDIAIPIHRQSGIADLKRAIVFSYAVLRVEKLPSVDIG